MWQTNANCQPYLEIYFMINFYPCQGCSLITQNAAAFDVKEWLFFWSWSVWQIIPNQSTGNSEFFFIRYVSIFPLQPFILDRRISYHCWLNSWKGAAIHCKVWDLKLLHQMCFTEGLQAHACLIEWQGVWWLKQCPCRAAWVITMEAPPTELSGTKKMEGIGVRKCWKKGRELYLTRKRRRVVSGRKLSGRRRQRKYCGVGSRYGVQRNWYKGCRWKQQQCMEPSVHLLILMLASL